ncbi:hypothetical protein NDU88_007237 [Pleurodeles waltl]|uniref:Uncharacterized protein n=1 Tax=Pleurodeles waltl TaxID=8319 RepID=A0AAV7MJN5_PLEWA|nr:hypothetical protein NDU88_007237 [Pleurodeles waltl]
MGGHSYQALRAVPLERLKKICGLSAFTQIRYSCRGPGVSFQGRCRVVDGRTTAVSCGQCRAGIHLLGRMVRQRGSGERYKPALAVLDIKSPHQERTEVTMAEAHAKDEEEEQLGTAPVNLRVLDLGATDSVIPAGIKSDHHDL